MNIASIKRKRTRMLKEYMEQQHRHDFLVIMISLYRGLRQQLIHNTPTKLYSNSEFLYDELYSEYDVKISDTDVYQSVFHWNLRKAGDALNLPCLDPSGDWTLQGTCIRHADDIIQLTYEPQNTIYFFDEEQDEHLFTYLDQILHALIHQLTDIQTELYWYEFQLAELNGQINMQISA